MTGFADLARAARLARAERPTVPLALATLVQVVGSSYRQPGARLLVDAESRILAGAISGGCLEGDVAARAAEVCASGQSARLMYDLRADLETIWGFGAACGGVAHLLLEPLPDVSWLETADAIRHRRHGGALVAILPKNGGGATAALLEGTAARGGWARWPAQSALLDTPAVRAIADAATDLARKTAAPVVTGDDDGLRLFVEPLIAPVALHLVGAGRGAEACARLARLLEWDVTIIDHRPALLAALDIDHDVRTAVVRADASAAERLSGLVCDERTAVALLSHSFDVDVAWLSALLPEPVGYIGVLGSRQRAARLLAQAERAVGPISRRLHAPIGLDLGGESPASIALSAVAEIEAVMHNRPAGSLCERQSPIHLRTPTPQIAEERTPTRDDQDADAF